MTLVHDIKKKQFKPLGHVIRLENLTLPGHIEVTRDRGKQCIA